MRCHRVDVGGIVGFICSRNERRRRCSICKEHTADYECDFPLKGRKTGKTCDAALCARCASEIAHDRHYCPPHKKLADQITATPPTDPVVAAHAHSSATEETPDAEVEPSTAP